MRQTIMQLQGAFSDWEASLWVAPDWWWVSWWWWSWWLKKCTNSSQCCKLMESQRKNFNFNVFFFLMGHTHNLLRWLCLYSVYCWSNNTIMRCSRSGVFFILMKYWCPGVFFTPFLLSRCKALPDSQHCNDHFNHHTYSCHVFLVNMILYLPDR